MGLTRIIAAAIVLASTRSRSGVMKINKRALVVTAALCGVFAAFGYVMTQNEYGMRRSGSNTWRLGSFVAIAKGIMRSPVIGNGSMATDCEMEAWHEEAMGDRAVVRALLGKNGAFAAYSQILQAWYEGGVCAVPDGNSPEFRWPWLKSKSVGGRDLSPVVPTTV
jgi:hypothetical protein